MEIGKGNIGVGVARQGYNNVFANARKAQIENQILNNPNKNLEANNKSNNDTLQISDEEAQLNAEKEKLDRIKEERAREARENISKQIQALREMDELRKQAKNAQEQGEAMGDALGDLSKCMTIAGRIINGDIVPMKDEQFLAEKQPEMYMKAVTLRKLNEDPEEYDSILEEEKEDAPTDVGSAESAEIAELEGMLANSGGEATATDNSGGNS